MGFSYGIIFGWMDVEDASMYKLEVYLMQEESYCWPIGLLLGGVGGVLNEILRQNVRYIFVVLIIKHGEYKFEDIEKDLFNEEI